MPTALIGREHPAGVLRAELTRLLDSHGGLVLVTGEAGIGKSTLVAEMAVEAHRRGARVLSGSCWEGDGAPGYWPWVQVVRNLARSSTTDEWSAVTATVGDALPVLLGETGAAGTSTASEGTSFRIHDAFATLLVTAARDRPLVIVLDDLQWADQASVRLLDFVVRHTWFEPLLVVGTYRDVEVEAPEHPLRPLLPPLLARATEVRLGGLGRAEVGALIERITGRVADDDTVAEVYRRTGGNPFFVEQTAQLGPSQVPGEPAAGVRDAIARRLALLASPVVELLGVAAVIGAEFDAGLLAAATGTGLGEVAELLAPAITTRLVAPGGAGRFGFTHGLVRECLYAGLGDHERRRLHASVVSAVEQRRGPPGTLAHHARLAVPLVEAQVAVAHLLAAASDATGRLASEEAARHYRDALALIEPARERALLELELGAALDRAGELSAARTIFHGVVDVGRVTEDAELVARAALGVHRLGNPDDDARIEIALMDDALDGLARGPDPGGALAARVLAAASMARTHKAVELDRARALSRRAVELARRHDDTTLGWCLLADHDARWEPGTSVARIELLDELSTVARRAGDRELEALASFLRTVALLELGSPRAHQELAGFEALTERTRLPRHRFLALSRRGALALLAGEFDAALGYVDDAFAFGERVGAVDRAPMWRDQVWALELLRGRHSEADAVLRASDQADLFVGFLWAFGSAYRGEAGAVLPRMGEFEGLFDGFPRQFRSWWLCFQALVAIAGGDSRLCAKARGDLAPMDGGWLAASGGGVVWGPTRLWTARLEATMGHWDDAVAGFIAAAEAADLLSARPWSVLARAHLAAALRERADSGDRASAMATLAAARREATELGMLAALDGLDDLDAGSARQESTAVRGPAAYPTENEFRFDGEVWTLGFAGRTAHMRDAKGLHDLAVLLGRPGTDVSVTELLNPRAGPAVAPSRRLGTDPMIDERARRAYRDRISALDEQIRDALDAQDDRRAATADREREALLDELRRTTGLGRRARRLGDNTERARQTVTARIRDVLRRLGSLHPELAEHLGASVSTGTHCRYQPPVPTRWTLSRPNTGS